MVERSRQNIKWQRRHSFHLWWRTIREDRPHSKRIISVASHCWPRFILLQYFFPALRSSQAVGRAWRCTWIHLRRSSSEQGVDGRKLEWWSHEGVHVSLVVGNYTCAEPPPKVARAIPSVTRRSVQTCGCLWITADMNYKWHQKFSEGQSKLAIVVFLKRSAVSGR